MENFLQKCALVLAGGVIQGFGMGVFLFPNSIPSGGAGGLAVLLNYFFNINVGFALWLVNFSMIAAAIRYLGKRIALWTVVSISVTSLAVYFFERNIQFTFNSPWFDLLIGSVFLGIGIGLLLKEDVSNGGVGVIALILVKMKDIDPGKPLFWINASIFLLTAYIIRWEIILQAILSQWISTHLVDVIFKLGSYKFCIITWRKN